MSILDLLLRLATYAGKAAKYGSVQQRLATQEPEYAFKYISAKTRDITSDPVSPCKAWQDTGVTAPPRQFDASKGREIESYAPSESGASPTIFVAFLPLLTP